MSAEREMHTTSSSDPADLQRRVGEILADMMRELAYFAENGKALA